MTEECELKIGLSNSEGLGSKKIFMKQKWSTHQSSSRSVTA